MVFSDFDDGDADGWDHVAGVGSVVVDDGALVQQLAGDTTTLVTRSVGAANVVVEVRARIAGVSPVANLAIVTRLNGTSGFMCDLLAAGGTTNELDQHNLVNNGAGSPVTGTAFVPFATGAPLLLRAVVDGGGAICSGTIGGFSTSNSRTVGAGGVDVGLRFRRVTGAIDSVVIYALD